jgi:hypothetical protein
MPAGTKVLVGAPANAPPQELLQNLAARCQLHTEIEVAYVFQTMFLAEGEQPHLALGVVLTGEASEERTREIADDLGEHAHPLRPEDEFLEIQFLNAETLPPVSRAVEPIFRRRD